MTATLATDPGPFARYLDHINEAGCWVTGLAPNSSGYAAVWVGTRAATRRRVGIHVASYSHFVGTVPPGLVIDHFVCDNRLCFNPAHLKAVTQLENVRRACARLRLQPFPCGHDRTPQNTAKNGTSAAGHPVYRCRACNNIRRAGGAR